MAQEIQLHHHITHQHHLNGNHHHTGQAQPFESATRSGTATGSGAGSPSQSPVDSPQSTTTATQHDSPTTQARFDANFHHWLMEGDVEGLTEDLSEQHLTISDLVRKSDNSTALHIAASAGQRHLISHIVSHQPDLLHCPNSKGDLPIHVAVRAGHRFAAMTLLNCAADAQISCQMLEAPNNESNTALHIALQNHQRELADDLFAKCPHTFYKLNAQGISPLYLAIKAMFWDLVKDMLRVRDDDIDAGNVESQLCRGNSVVHAAITATNSEILTALIEKYEELIISLDEKKKSPLSYCAYTGFLEGVKYLLDKFKNQAFNEENDGSFPIHAACSGGNLLVVEEFLSRGTGSMRWLLNRKGQNILHVAAESGQVEVVSYLLKRGNIRNMINMKDEDGNTPLHLATLGKHPKVVYALTWDKEVKLNLQNNEHLTAFDLAEDFGEVPSFEERLTWLALRYAGVPKAPVHITTQTYNVDLSMVNFVPSGLVHNNEYIPITLVDPERENPAQKRHPPKRKNKYKDRLNTLLMVSTLVATVTFAAGFTVPGGYNDDDPSKGLAILAHKCAFQVFVISNTIAMYSSILAMVTLIWAHLDDLRLILLSLDFALPLLGISLGTMSVAYMAALYVVLHSQSQWWLGVVVLVMGGVFLGALLVFFVPLNSPTSRVKSRILRYVFHVPFKLMLLACEKGPRQSFY